MLNGVGSSLRVKQVSPSTILNFKTKTKYLVILHLIQDTEVLQLLELVIGIFNSSSKSTHYKTVHNSKIASKVIQRRLSQIDAVLTKLLVARLIA